MSWVSERARRAAAALALAALSAAAAGATEAEAPADEGQRLLASGTLEDARAATAHFEARLAASPDDYDARLGAARALTMQMALRTNGNLPLFDGLQDTDAHRAIWADLGPRGVAHARRALALRPGSVEAAAILATSFMFQSASQGIVAAILGGTAGEFRTNAQRVIDLDPAYDDAVGHTLLAGFYMVAPWPVADSDLALEHYQKADRLSPDSVRTQYGLGVYWAREGEPERAKPHFQRALERSCSTDPERSERLLCDFIKKESRRALAAL